MASLAYRAPTSDELVDQLDEARETIAQLRQQARDDAELERIHRLRAVHAIAPGPARTLLALYRRRPRPVNRYLLEQTLPSPGKEREQGPKIIDVYVSTLRAALGHQAIHTAWGFGYAITPAGAALVDSALGELAP
jgi:DNA-binding response OmpR family regulator